MISHVPVSPRGLAKLSVAELQLELLTRAQQTRFAAIERAEATLATLRAKHARGGAEVMRLLDRIAAAQRATAVARKSKTQRRKSKNP